MEGHDNVVKDLNAEFKKVDRAFQTSEMRIFGENTDRIFKELDVIRRKQINLAGDHVSLEALNDIPLKQTAAAPATTINNRNSNNAAATAENSVFSAESFQRKEVVLKKMMEKLDDLTQAMDRFRKFSEQNYQGDDTLITSEQVPAAAKENSLAEAADQVQFQDQLAPEEQVDLYS